MIELAVKTAQARNEPRSYAALALILGVQLPRTKKLLPGLWAMIIAVLKGSLDWVSQMIVIRAIHWGLATSMAERIGLAGEVLMEGAFFDEFAAANPEFAAGAAVANWAAQQISQALAAKPHMTLGEAREWMANPGNLVEMAPVPAEPPAVEFDFAAHLEEICDLLEREYFLGKTGIDLRPKAFPVPLVAFPQI